MDGAGGEKKSSSEVLFAESAFSQHKVGFKGQRKHHIAVLAANIIKRGFLLCVSENFGVLHVIFFTVVKRHELLRTAGSLISLFIM